MQNNKKQKEELVLELQKMKAYIDEQQEKLTKHVEETKHLHNIIKTNQDKYQLFLNNAPFIYQSLDFNRCFIDVNQAWIDFMGFRKEDVIGKKFDEFLSPEYKSVLVDSFKRFIENGRLEEELDLLHQNGSKLCVKISGRLEYANNGNTMLTHCILSDITDRKSLEEELISLKKKAEKSEERYDLAMEASHDGLFDWNLETNEIYYSPGWKKMIGYENNELKNDFSVWELTTLPEDVERSWKLQKKLISGEIDRFVLEFKMQHKDGHWVDILSRAKAIFNEKGTAIRIVGTHTDISARKEAEIKLRDEKEQFKTIINMVADPIFVKDNDHKITIANNAFCEIFNFKEKDIIGYTLAEHVPENEREQFLSVDRKVLDEGISDIREETLTIDKKTKTIVTSKKRFVDKSGNKFLVGSIHDITKQKQAIEDLAKSESRLNLALETGYIGAWDLNLIDHSAHRTLIHDQIFGYETLLDEWTFEMFLDHVIPEDKKYVEKTFTDAIESVTDWQFECRILRIDGEQRWIKAKGQHQLNFEGKPIILSGIVEDITDRKFAEIELIKAKELAEENEDKFKTYSQDSPIAIYTTDENGDCIYTNNKWLEMAGMTIEECLGKGWGKAIHPEDREKVIENWYKSVKSNGKWTFEYRFITPNGDVTFVEDSAKKLLNKDGKLIGYLGSIVDITERKKAESLLVEKNEELILAKEKAEESDRLKSAFLANMSHEIRTPMNSILGFTDLLKGPNVTVEKQKKYHRIIMESGSRLLNIIDDIVDISKIEAGLIGVELEEINIGDQLEYIYSMFKPEVEAKGMDFTLSYNMNCEHLSMITDKEKILACLINLVKNSIKYTEKGFIDFGFEIIESDKNKMVQFFVKDSGIGISKQRHGAIFERFIQADINDKMARQGAGLGLAITKSHIEMLGGTIWVNSELNKGATFYFTLPLISELKETNY